MQPLVFSLVVQQCLTTNYPWVDQVCFMDISCSHCNNVLPTGPQVGINGRARILPGMSSRQTEIKAFQGNVMD